MAESEQDARWMGRALGLARASVGLASPNPEVGCVLVRDGAVVGEGAHLYDALDHAEIVALKQAGQRAAETTAYVTLEPCSHQGRTGPCVDALISAGVRRVVAATLDPNPTVSGNGLARLRSAGIAVRVGVMEDVARELNDGFAKFIRTGRPLVTLKAGVSADGMIAPAAGDRNLRETYWISGAEARTEVQRMRHGADAVLTGIGTVLADDPLLTDRSEGARRRRLLRVVLDSELRMPVDSQIVNTNEADVLVVCGQRADAGRAGVLTEAGVEVIRVEPREVGGKGYLDLAEVLAVLGRRQILNVLLECGRELNGAFLREELVDRAVMFRSSKELGADAVRFAEGMEPIDLELRMARIARVGFGADVRVSGVLCDPWSALG